MSTINRLNSRVRLTVTRVIRGDHRVHVVSSIRIVPVVGPNAFRLLVVNQGTRQFSRVRDDINYDTDTHSVTYVHESLQFG